MIRLFTFLAALLLSASVSFSRDKEMTIDVTGKKMEQVLKEISSMTGVYFSYDLSVVDTPVPVRGKVSGTLKTVLDTVFSGTGIEWTEISSDRIALTRKAVPKTDRKRIQVKGKVTDAEGNPLPGVAVMENVSNATVTDADGLWSLTVSADGILKFNCIGYKDTEEKVLSRGVINVTMQEEVLDLDELVVVGYRTVKKISLTGSVSTISAKAKEDQPITNTTQMLYNTPGIWVNQGGSQP
ncbi:MAG: carboxypeptidase-like regulatory domain-containing protein, partial [Candidatus Cryptobacteroides sp.]